MNPLAAAFRRMVPRAGLARSGAAVALLALSTACAIGAPAPPAVHARGAILEDAATGAVLWQSHADTPRPMASTTKIMTGLLVAEHDHLGETVTVSPTAAAVGESSLHLKAGETLTLHDLLYGILLRSANDGCVAAAEHISGTEAAFVQRMNDKAAALGCRHTHFVNAYGLHDPNHYTTPRDLAAIARAALQDPVLREIVGTPTYTIERSINKYDPHLKARDYSFLTHYPGAEGVKTGYTRQAGHCFVGTARRGGFQLVSVVLHSPNFNKETAALLDWGFKNFRGGVAVKAGEDLGDVRVAGGRAARVAAVAAQAVSITVPINAPRVRADLGALSVRAPIKAGQALGFAPLMSGGKQVGRVAVAASNAVGISIWSLIGRLAGGALLLMVIGVILGAIAENSRRRRRRLAARSRRPDPRGSREGERQGGAAGRERGRRR
jgi:D-alanyl-D-alanine carboxypeptidase (penicillin-binding protein 5/6)